MQEGFIHAESLNGKIMKAQVFRRHRADCRKSGNTGLAKDAEYERNGFHRLQDNSFPRQAHRH